MNLIEVNKLIVEYKRTGSPSLRNDILVALMPLVHNIARALQRRLVEYADVDHLESFGFTGLLKALDKFDPARGFAFTTYANQRIRGEMLDGLRSEDYASRIGRSAARRLNDAADRFKACHGRPPTRDELRKMLQVSTVKFDRLIAAVPYQQVLTSKTLYLDDNGTATTVGDIIGERRPVDPDAMTDSAAIIDIILRDYGVTDALLLRLRFLEGWTLEQCGEAFGGLSGSGMSIRLKILLDKLRRRFAPELFAALAGKAAA